MPRIKLSIVFESGARIGPGKAALLESIRVTGGTVFVVLGQNVTVPYGALVIFQPVDWGVPISSDPSVLRAGLPFQFMAIGKGVARVAITDAAKTVLLDPLSIITVS